MRFSFLTVTTKTSTKKEKPGTKAIAVNIFEMMKTVKKIQSEITEILQYSQETNDIVSQAASNFEAMIGDFEQSDDQLLKIAAAIEELSMNNAEILTKVKAIDGLTHEVSIDMKSTETSVSYNRQFDAEFQNYFDAVLDELNGSIYAVTLDVNGYLSTHHKKFSKTPTGNYEVDVLISGRALIKNDAEPWNPPDHR